MRSHSCSCNATCESIYVCPTHWPLMAARAMLLCGDRNSLASGHHFCPFRTRHLLHAQRKGSLRTQAVISGNGQHAKLVFFGYRSCFVACWLLWVSLLFLGRNSILHHEDPTFGVFPNLNSKMCKLRAIASYKSKAAKLDLASEVRCPADPTRYPSSVHISELENPNFCPNH